MGRLVRGLWHVEATFPGRIAMEPPYPVEYDHAAVLAPMIGEDGATRAILRRLPGSRARWEYLAPWEASDLPQWGETP
jgi:hypothetical protein